MGSLEAGKVMGRGNSGKNSAGEVSEDDVSKGHAEVVAGLDEGLSGG